MGRTKNEKYRRVKLGLGRMEENERIKLIYQCAKDSITDNIEKDVEALMSLKGVGYWTALEILFSIGLLLNKGE